MKITVKELRQIIREELQAVGKINKKPTMKTEAPHTWDRGYQPSLLSFITAAQTGRKLAAVAKRKKAATNKNIPTPDSDPAKIVAKPTQDKIVNQKEDEKPDSEKNVTKKKPVVKEGNPKFKPSNGWKKGPPVSDYPDGYYTHTIYGDVMKYDGETDGSSGWYHMAMDPHGDTDATHEKPFRTAAAAIKHAEKIGNK